MYAWRAIALHCHCVTDSQPSVCTSIRVVTVHKVDHVVTLMNIVSRYYGTVRRLSSKCYTRLLYEATQSIFFNFRLLENRSTLRAKQVLSTSLCHMQACCVHFLVTWADTCVDVSCNIFIVIIIVIFIIPQEDLLMHILQLAIGHGCITESSVARNARSPTTEPSQLQLFVHGTLCRLSSEINSHWWPFDIN